MTGIATNQMAIRDILIRGDCLTLDELDAALPPIARKEIVKAMNGLITRGLAERVERGCYQLTKDGEWSFLDQEVLTSGPNGAHSRRVRTIRRQTLRQRAWNVMRLGKAFTIPELVTATSTGERDPVSALQRYCKQLERSGYLVRLPRRERGSRPGSNGYLRWRLLDDTGPEAPIFKAKKQVMFDGNTREARPLREARLLREERPCL